MARFFSGIFLSFMSLLAYAIQEPAVAPPSTSADPTAMIIFAIVFFGAIGISVWFMWRNERKHKARESETK